MKISFHFIKDVFTGSSQNNAASFWFFAINHEGEVFISDLSDIKEATVFTNIRFLEFFWSIHDFSSSNSGNTIIISFSNSSDAIFLFKILSDLEEDKIIYKGFTKKRFPSRGNVRQGQILLFQ
jgi:hypothetical protein